MQVVLNNKKNNSKNKRWAYAIIIISSIGYFALFTNFLKFLKSFLLGFFGLFSYPLFFLGYSLGFILLKNKKFSMPKKYIVYLCLALFSLLAIFHVAFSSHFPLTSYGAYLSEAYTSKMSVCGLLMSLITYPLVKLVQYFGTYVVFAILLIFSTYKVIDYFIINKSSKGFVSKNKNIRVEEVQNFSKDASIFLNNQLLEEDKQEPFSINPEIKTEPDKREIARQKLGLGDIRNTPSVIKTTPSYSFNNNQNAAPIFSDTENHNLDNELNNFSAFNGATYSKKTLESKSKKERNLDFLRATMDANYNRNTTEQIASEKKRNLNLADNMKGLPINDYLGEEKPEVKSSSFEENKQENDYNSNKNEKSNSSIVDHSSSAEKINESNGNKKETNNISSLNINDIINSVKKAEPNKEKDEVENKPKFKQTDLLNTPKPTKATYKKPSRYIRPTIDLLNSISTNPEDYGENCEEKAALIERTLENFRVPAKVINITKGPSVTRYELEMPAGISVNKILQYQNDISMAVASSHGVRIEAPIPGKSAVGIEVPNNKIATISLKEVLDSKEFYSSNAPLTFALGKDIAGKLRVCNIASMPHLLIAGSTGSGKSVCLTSLIISLLYKCSPDDLRLILIDPKRVEFFMYNNLPHLLIPEVITSSEKAINAFNYAIKEMERRFEEFQELYVKNLEEYNQTQEVANGEKPKLPYIVIIVDEMNDLMSTNKKEIEDRVIKLAQKSRAAGIHLILATQRPSVDVITGTIKANLPSRIAFAVTSNVDSKTILDSVGAEKLLGRGDMLYSPREYPEPVRIQGAYCSNEEIKAVVDFVKSNNEAIFDEQAEREINAKNHSENGGYVDNSEEMDPLLPDALKFFIEIQQASISKLQRMFSIGFNRAGKIVDQMEKLHYISPQDGSRPRSVYITMDEFMEIYGDKY